MILNLEFINKGVIHTLLEKTDYILLYYLNWFLVEKKFLNITS